MEFDELTDEEKIIVKAFNKLWKERDISPIFINEASSNSLCKIKGKWATFFYVRDEIYDYKEYDSLYEGCMHYFKALGKDNSEYCISMFPELIKKLKNGEEIYEPKYVKYEDLSSEEQKILDIFLQLLKDTGDYIRDIVYPWSEKDIDCYEERLQCYKKGNVWVSYILERNEKCGYREYYTIYSMCLDAFHMIEKDNSDYCLDRFPLMVQEALNKSNEKAK